MRCLVTGAASGIGYAIADRLARDYPGSCHLMLVDRDQEGLKRASDHFAAIAAAVVPITADLSDPASFHELGRVAQEEMGSLDAVVSNAGLIQGSSLLDLEVADFDRVFAVNTRATWLLAKAVHPLLAKAGGSLVATASVLSNHAGPGSGVYSASKAALVMLVRQLALEWADDGIRCNCVSPGTTWSAMTEPRFADPERRSRRERSIPLRRIAAPEEIANVVAFLISKDASYVTGINLLVDGGFDVSLMFDGQSAISRCQST